jgi:S-adenosylmethionine:tRNA ribosyltransferase-isomerase
MYSLDDYDYELPRELIAQVPASSRDESRLMVLERKPQSVSHHHFSDMMRLLSPGDLLVINNTRVVPARLTGTKETGGRVEVLLLNYPGQTPGSYNTESLTCECMVKASKPSRPGSKFDFDGDLRATVLGGANGLYQLKFHFKEDFDALIHRIGQIPLPPYIERDETAPPPCDDRSCYQTVYAEKKGAVAAPTAGLHFSGELLKGLEEMGVEIVPITLHVGYGTFLPVRVMDIREHQIHPEVYALEQGSAAAINKAKDEGRRIIAVGSTAVRVLEFASDPSGHVRAGSGTCDLFIYAGYAFRVIDALITNFHLPKSTLLMLVTAFAGRDFVLNAYEKAIRRRYRFYSYGDAMLIF